MPEDLFVICNLKFYVHTQNGIHGRMPFRHCPSFESFLEMDTCSLKFVEIWTVSDFTQLHKDYQVVLFMSLKTETAKSGSD